MTLHLERHGEIAVVTLDNPPVNALSRTMRAALADMADRLDGDAGIRAVVLAGAGRLFVGGADIAEFDGPPQEPHLPDLLARIEAARAPWIAAVHGMALGGGTEIALACRYRVAAPGSRFGLPEVNLGIIPGSGGTQRLPRLIGVEAAVPVVAEKRMLDATEALGSGLVDRIIDGPLVVGAVDFARDMLNHPLPPLARDRSVTDPGPAYWQAAEARIAKASKGQSAPPLALLALRHGVQHGFEAGLRQERETFLRLRAGDEAAALRYLFFAERAAPRPADLRGTPPRAVARVGVVGGGTMGVGIAAALRNAGLPVILSERDQPGLERGLTALRAVFDAAAQRGLISDEAASARMAGVRGVVGLEALADCDLVIEAVFEDLAVKQAVFKTLASLCGTDTILATNTSYIDPRQIFNGLRGPERCIGLHFFSPAQVMKLMEIIPLPETAPAVLATAFDLAANLGKVPVRAGICDGFIGNRILKHYRAEAEALLREGVPHAAIDAAMRGFGYAMGPFEMQDMAGLDIAFLHREAARLRGETVPETAGDILVRAGRKGQKTGGGWYDYPTGTRAPQPSDEVARLLAPLLGPARAMPAEQIVARLIAAMAAEGQRIIDEGIASTPQDVDLVEVHGYGFPRGKGGPMFLAARKTITGIPTRIPT
ncbi:3-hydroxyacyl-CoA dehydrogenase NAD-binding domain-containing protein [Tabrizicola fusiformis]|uniref:3-hydroxyacyl-CoA dehydrogenase NAD-binding domain-containing protein n=1 Tax=Tabrizicola sp. SY72 TaxID=2741673 RepID=UPI0015748961|nr:3-hydroxyacyl-CoA dehydrogenase NAD-binding domain-containing protein [Tabrizicola sp. SY72]NTT87647.1 enoyl-CoA hydratase/isomerase family protein [Tabrizicola sp. SY72]